MKPALSLLLLALLATEVQGQQIDLTIDERLGLVGGQECKRESFRGDWGASVEGVASCLGLACVEDLATPDSIGQCARHVNDGDCAGLARNADRSCGTAPKSHLVPEVRATRFLATANSMILSDSPGNWGIKPQGMISGFYQTAFTRSHAHRGPDGVWTHTKIPTLMLHLGGHATSGERQLVGWEVGLVKQTTRKLLGLPLTRLAVFGLGQWHAAGSLIGSRVSIFMFLSPMETAVRALGV